MRNETFRRRRLFLKSTLGLAGLCLLASERDVAQQLPFEDVVVLLPGIAGSVLRKNGHDVWAMTGHSISDALFTLGKNIQGLKLREDPQDVEELGDGVVATELFPDAHLIPGLWKIDGYSSVYSALSRRVPLQRGQNFFEFPYDWRRDNRVAARRLARLAPRWLDQWKQSSGHSDAKLVLVAHSMGGLVARYYLECLEGWRYARKLITFGTPYRGSLNALDFLVNGYNKRFAGFSVADLSELMRSFTSVYQLLPRYPCVETEDGMLRRPGELAKLDNLDARKAAEGLAFHHELEQAICKNRRTAQYVSYGIHPIIGVDQVTRQSATVRNGRVTVLNTIRGNDAGGDGTVPRPSAVPLGCTVAEDDAFEGAALFVSGIHGDLQNLPQVLAQVSYVLSGPDFERYRNSHHPPDTISLEVEDAYTASEPIAVSCRSGPRQTHAVLSIEEALTGKGVQSRDIALTPDQWTTMQIGVLSHGTYRAKLKTAVNEISDIFLVAV